MEPEYSVGDLIYVKEVDPSTVKVGDVITFVVNEDLVVGTHRVVRIDNEKKQFITKGDTNDTEDAPVHFKNLIGVPEFAIPKLGYVSDFIQNPPGTYITVGIGLLLILIVFLPDIFGKKEKEEEKVTETAAPQGDFSALSEENERLKAEIERLKAERTSETPLEELAEEQTEESAEEPLDKPE
jgi:signal peptidase